MVAQMSLACRNNLVLLPEHKFRNIRHPFYACFQPPITGKLHDATLVSAQGQIGRISEMFKKKVELSVSSYDTAWVAMVPSREFPHKQPCFPGCLDWVLENQHPDGSWGLHPSHKFLVKDCLSSTLACILALQKWKVGKLLVKKGLDFIESNSWAANDKQQYSPIGFDITFPGMINYAQELVLDLPLDPNLVDAMLRNRDLEVERAFRSGHEGKRGRLRLAYVAEGLMGKSCCWKEVMVHQRSNGSLFNSPSTTAAALIHLHDDDKCREYLHSLLQIYENGVPAIYPLNIYTRLSMVDDLERLGIDKNFRYEIQCVLDETYRCWLQRNEEMVLDVNCCAMAFRLLRMNGYDVSSDALAEFDEQEHFFNSVSAQFTETRTILELFKASQITIYQEEPTLEKIQAWTGSFLKHHILNRAIHDQRLHKEVEDTLMYSHRGIERLENRRNIEQYNYLDNFQLLKTSYRCSNINNRDFIEFSLQSFNTCQAIHQEELKHLERWLKDTRLECLKFFRQRLSSCYFSIAAIIFFPETSDARISLTQNCVLATAVDDLFDVGGSRQELLNLTELVQEWDGHSAIGYCSEQVEIIFSAIYNTTNELAAKASIQQGRSVRNHMIEIWINLLNCMMREFEWGRNETVPTMDEYMSNGRETIALGPIILIPLYFLGSELSDEVVRSSEYNNLYKHATTIGRLLNDLQTIKSAQGKLNSLSLYVIQGCGVISEEDAVTEIRRIIESNRRELLRMVLRKEGSLVPKACKDLFWKKTKILFYFYTGTDEYTYPSKVIGDINAVIHDQLILPTLPK